VFTPTGIGRYPPRRFSRPVPYSAPLGYIAAQASFGETRQAIYGGFSQWEVEATKNAPLTVCYHFATQLMNTGQDRVVSTHPARSGKPNKIMRKGMKANYGVQALANCVENAADFLCAVAGCKASAINRATKLGQPR
jgi:hypothetical protein